MGPNDSLPPPVPPGEPPRVPPPPPAVPQFPPTEALPPTQVMPPVLGDPGVPGGPVAPPPGAVPPGAPPTGAEPPKKNLVPWIIGAAVLVVALVLVAVFALRGDDESSGSPDTTGTVAPPTSVAPTTVAPTTAAPTTVAPTTVAPTTAPTTVAPTTSLPDAVVVADDTGTFTVLMLDTFETATDPVDVGGTLTPRVAGATDLQAWSQEDDHDTFGVEVLVADGLLVPEDVLAALDPGAEVCPDRSTKTDYPTLNGTAQALLLDGCGTDGAFAKVVMVVPFPDRDVTLVALAQGQGPANTDLFDFTQVVVESVVLL